jgi:carboxymethylenebutenolidase
MKQAGRARGAEGVLLLHAWWGLTDDVSAYAERLAGEGFAVRTPDLFDGRTAATPEEAEALVGAIDPAAAGAAALAGAERLATLVPGGPLAAIGFSYGAPWALGMPERNPRFRGSVLYYGTGWDEGIAAGRTPVLGHFAPGDPYEPDDWVAELEARLRASGRSVALHRYLGAGHWFAEPSRSAYDPAAAELAFERTLDFLRRLR